MTYRCYVGAVRLDDEAGVFRGKVVNVTDTITFQGETVEGVRQAFRDSVDDYLEFCASRGEDPDKPFSGRIPLRVRPDVHRTLSVVAKLKGQSLNAMLSKIVGLYARRAEAGLMSEARHPPAAANTTSGDGSGTVTAGQGPHASEGIGAVAGSGVEVTPHSNPVHSTRD